MVIAFQSLPPDAPFSDVLDELQSPGGFEIMGFRPKFHPDGTAVKNHTADHVLKEVPELRLATFCAAFGQSIKPGQVCKQHMLHTKFTEHFDCLCRNFHGG